MLWAATMLQRRPSFILHHPTFLGLQELKFDDLDQILCLLCLLRSLPSLEILDILTFTALESVSRHLESPGCMEDMSNLQRVKFVSVKCSKFVMLMVKCILSRSPNLHSMNFEYIYDKNEEFNYSNILLHFRRASAKAEVIYTCRELASTKWAHHMSGNFSPFCWFKIAYHLLLLRRKLGFVFMMNIKLS